MAARERRDRRAGAMLLEGAELLGAARGARGPVLVRGSRIAALGSEARRLARGRRAEVLDLEGLYLAPGLIDLHTHGAAGVDFVEAGPEDFERAARHYAVHGVTSILVSLYPGTWKRSLEACSRVADWIEAGLAGGLAVGIHLEGPFLNRGRPGALPARRFRTPSTRDAARLLDAARGHVRTVTVAPELPGGPALIRWLLRRGVVPAFGHSLADYETTRRALEQGVRYATHLFNAMTGMHHRRPGAVTALLEHPEVDVEVIADGHHVAPPVLRHVARLKGPEHVILVSDSVHPCGLRDGTYEFAGAEARLERGRITRPDGTLAGSALTLDRAVALQSETVGRGPEEAVRCATRNPARAAGLARTRGTIGRGRRADLVALDERLRPRATWRGGDLVWARRGSRFAGG